MPSRFCDGVTRRQALQAGLTGLAGLSLADLFRFQSQAAEPAPDTAVIYVLQEGGPPQHETYDPKPDAPVEIRGEFNAISTSVPGVQFSDIVPEQAKQMHRMTLLRSIHHPSTQHSSSVHLIKTGYYCRADANENELPSVGAYASRVCGERVRGVPPYVLLHTGERYDSGHFLGKGHNPFFVQMSQEHTRYQVPNLTLVEGVTTDRLNDRRKLLADFDQAQRMLDRRGDAEGIDQFQRKAFDMVTGPAARKAFDLDREPLKVQERYGRNPVGQKMLLARRLVEHGVRYVTVGTVNWDYHGALWQQMRRDMPAFDRALAALVEDLHDRGLDKKVLVVAMGEFGRTPQISSLPNHPPGRDHWGDAMSVLMAGGGLRGGQVVGATDGKGGRPTQSPYRLECVLAHMYRHMGIDPALTFNDHTGRPRHLLEIRDPISQLA
ncbi:MAG: DUF1501 domain-containing protein [Gemmataceae bacterium]|nr:DUF1501 domain-containing protein [Gemmataceae bacterium]